MFKKAVSLLLTLVFLMSAGLLAVHQFAPVWLIHASMNVGERLAGMQTHEVTVGDVRYSYYDNHVKNKPVLLLAHGFTSNKKAWLSVALRLKGQYRIIAPDLLGHGDSSQSMDFNYQTSNQAKYLSAFTDAIKLPKHHVLGFSMGGQIAGMYASQQPTKVHSLTLVDNAGIDDATMSPVLKRVLADNTDIPIIIKKPEDADVFFAYLMHKPPNALTTNIKHAYGRLVMNDAPLYTKIFNDFVLEGLEPLSEYLRTLQVPTQVFWGQYDAIVDISSVDVMKKVMPTHTQFYVFKTSGHVPHVEQAQLFIQRLTAFLNEHQPLHAVMSKPLKTDAFLNGAVVTGGLPPHN